MYTKRRKEFDEPEGQCRTQVSSGTTEWVAATSLDHHVNYIRKCYISHLACRLYLGGMYFWKYLTRCINLPNYLVVVQIKCIVVVVVVVGTPALASIYENPTHYRTLEFYRFIGRKLVYIVVSLLVHEHVYYLIYACLVGWCFKYGFLCYGT